MAIENGNGTGAARPERGGGSKPGSRYSDDNYRDVPGYGGKYKASKLGEVARAYASGKKRQLRPYLHRGRLVVKLTRDGKPREEAVLRLVAAAYLGEAPEGWVPYHRNGDQEDNRPHNIALSRRELGRRTGAKSMRRPVAKLDGGGAVVDAYASAREAARRNHMSYQTVIDRCNGKCKGAFAPDGHAYAWDDSEASMRQAIRKIGLLRDGFI